VGIPEASMRTQLIREATNDFTPSKRRAGRTAEQGLIELFVSIEPIFDASIIRLFK
jgi:hypothetical protein